jgi:peptidoglycan/xylan/chitin deacetylase (PgdA/CDA1 family)
MPRPTPHPLDGSATILHYHRVGDPGGDPLGLNVSPPKLEEQLRALCERFSIVPLRALIEEPGPGDGLPRIAITFDDGYAGVLHHGWPLLTRFGAPATAFVPSGFVGNAREFWWDELEALVLHDRPLPPSLELHVGARTFRWHANSRRLSLRARRSTPREHLYYGLAQLLGRARPLDRDSALGAVAEWADVDPPRRSDRMPLTADELRSLAAGGLEIGAHTVTHPVLASLDADEQAGEISQGKSDIEDLVGRPVTSFAYPYGGRTDFTDESVEAVRAAGFQRACANLQGAVEPNSDPYRLPRFIVRDWSGETLLRRIEHLLDRSTPGRILRRPRKAA